MGFKLADFFVDLRVQGDTLTLKTMVNSMADMKLETLGEIGALGALGLALKDVAGQALRLSTGYTAINKEYGTNITLLQRWQNVARASNVPAGDVAQTFTRMQQLLASPFIGNPSNAFNRAAGILGLQGANRMNAEQLNEALRVAVPRYVQRFTPTQGRENALTNAGSLIEAMGATRSMMQMYTLPTARFQRAEQNSPIMSAADVKNWTELNEQVEVAKNNLFLLGEEILAAALPELLKWTSALIDSEGWIKRRFGQAGEAAAVPFKEGPTGVWGHALAALLVPERVAQAGKTVVLHQTNNTDIDITGGDMGDVQRHQEAIVARNQQHQLTRAAQLLNAQVAY